VLVNVMPFQAAGLVPIEICKGLGARPRANELCWVPERVPSRCGWMTESVPKSLRWMERDAECLKLEQTQAEAMRKLESVLTNHRRGYGADVGY